MSAFFPNEVAEEPCTELETVGLLCLRSLAIAPGAVASWSGAFPYNPFQGPVLISAAPETGQLARGLLEGQRRQALAAARRLSRCPYCSPALLKAFR